MPPHSSHMTSGLFLFPKPPGGEEEERIQRSSNHVVNHSGIVNARAQHPITPQQCLVKRRALRYTESW